MTTYALNSGAINATPFPGAETGLSLIELLGTVEATCDLTALTIRLQARATTQPVANGTASTTKRSQVSATQSVTATCSAGVLSKIKFDGTTTGSATTSAYIRLKYPLPASGAANATNVSVTSYVRAKKSASTSATAATTISARTYVPRAAATAPSAFGSAFAQRKLAPASVAQVATANSSAGIVIRLASGANVASTATNTAAMRIASRRGATTAPTAASNAETLIKLLRYPDLQTASATCFPITPIRGISFAAITTANSAASATIGLNIILSAQAVGQAITSSAAADYATAMPAPAERLMTVQGSDRRMEVTE